MKSVKHGRSTSRIEVTNISQHGFWILTKQKEYYLPFEKYPWFKEAKIEDLTDVQLLTNDHIYWEKLDIDLSLNIILNPDKYPLESKA